MAKNDNLLGIEKIEFGAPGDGVMGGTLVAFTAVEVNSSSFSGAESNEETIPTEQEDAYLTVGNTANPSSFVTRLFEVHGTDAVLLMGGTWDAGSDTYNAPEAVADLYLSVRLTTKPINGKKMELEFPYAKVSARYEGNITKNNLLAVEATITANTPVSAAQVKGAPFSVRKIDA